MNIWPKTDEYDGHNYSYHLAFASCSPVTQSPTAAWQLYQFAFAFCEQHSAHAQTKLVFHDKDFVCKGNLSS